MARPSALTPDQEDEVRGWYAAGATVDDVVKRAAERGWTVGRTRLGQLRQEGGAELEIHAASVTPKEARRRGLGVAVALAEHPGVDVKARVAALVALTRLLASAAIEDDPDPEPGKPGEAPFVVGGA